MVVNDRGCSTWVHVGFSPHLRWRQSVGFHRSAVGTLGRKLDPYTSRFLTKDGKKESVGEFFSSSYAGDATTLSSRDGLAWYNTVNCVLVHREERSRKRRERAIRSSDKAVLLVWSVHVRIYSLLIHLSNSIRRNRKLMENFLRVTSDLYHGFRLTDPSKFSNAMRCSFRPSRSIFDWMSMLPLYLDFCIDSNHILNENISLIDAIVIDTTKENYTSIDHDNKSDLLILHCSIPMLWTSPSLRRSSIPFSMHSTRISHELNSLTDRQREKSNLRRYATAEDDEKSKQEGEEIHGKDNDCPPHEHQQNDPEVENPCWLNKTTTTTMNRRTMR